MLPSFKRLQPQRFLRTFASFPDASAIPTTQISTLNNGLRVASEANGGETATVGVWVNTGSRFETAENNGANHFLEHMFFKGASNGAALVDTVENAGTALNAYSSREGTYFYFQGLKSDTAQMVATLGDMIQNTNLSDTAINAERATIIQEIEETEADIPYALFDRLHETAYRNHSLGRSILGHPQNIESFTSKDLTDFRDTHYTGSNIVLSAAGNVDHEALVKSAEGAFGGLPQLGPELPVSQPAMFTGSEIRIRYDSHPRLHLAVGFPTAGFNDSDTVNLMVCQNLIGNWDRSTAWGSGHHHANETIQKMSRTWNGESLSTFHTTYSDTGLFGWYATLNERHVHNILEDLFALPTGLFYYVDDIGLESAKNQTKTKYLARLSSNDQIAEDIGRQITAHGRRIHPREMLKRIDAVHNNDIKDTAARYFYDRDFALAAIGPTLEMQDYGFYRFRTYFSRY